MAKKLGIFSLLLLLLAGLAIAASPQLAGPVSGKYNPVTEPGPYLAPDAATAKLHQSLSLVDLHADPLLWGRDLLKRSQYGQVDLPRLIEGNMALQVFGVVTQSPKGQNFTENSADTDRLKLLVMAQHWPRKTWDSFLQRALFQAERLNTLVNDSEKQLRWVRDQAELAALTAARANGETAVGALLGLEGAHALEGNPANVDVLFNAGFRMLGMAHFIDNKMTGSAHGTERGGLSNAGREALMRAQKLGMVIDIAHSSAAAVEEIFDLATAPLVVSHTGVRATCDSPRNLTDDMLRRLKANGGVAGIAMFPGAVCGKTIDHTVQAILHAVKIAGVEHVAIGADFDGGVTAPIDVSGMHKLTSALREAGLSDADIKAISGNNALRVFRQVLPATTSQ